MAAGKNPSEFATLVLAHIAKRGLRHLDLAEGAGLTQPALSKILNGAQLPRPELARGIAAALKLDKDETRALLRAALIACFGEVD